MCVLLSWIKSVWIYVLLDHSICDKSFHFSQSRIECVIDEMERKSGVTENSYWIEAHIVHKKYQLVVKEMPDYA